MAGRVGGVVYAAALVVVVACGQASGAVVGYIGCCGCGLSLVFYAIVAQKHLYLCNSCSNLSTSKQHALTKRRQTMANLTFTKLAPFEDASDKAIKRVVNVHVNGYYEDTMIVSGYASDKEIVELYQQRLIDAEETKLAWGW